MIPIQTSIFGNVIVWLGGIFGIIDKLPHGDDPPILPTPKWWTKYYVIIAMQMTLDSTFHRILITQALQL